MFDEKAFDYRHLNDKLSVRTEARSPGVRRSSPSRPGACVANTPPIDVALLCIGRANPFIRRTTHFG